MEHAKAFSDSTMEAFQQSFDKILIEGPEEAFKNVN